MQDFMLEGGTHFIDEESKVPI